jgi:tRNA-Thr(GGU) m(6)t(6)A37 methyltransferase TsaA
MLGFPGQGMLRWGLSLSSFPPSIYQLFVMQLKLIGRIRSAFANALGTPIQPRFAGGHTGEAEVFPEYAEGLRDLAGFDRVWLIFWCHRASDARLSVVPYRDTVERGIFATRAPSRPNPIGLSCVRLIRIETNILHLAEVDILDGSPLLDIKPYVPDYDVYPVARTGWIGERGLDVVAADGRFEQPS